MAAAAEPQGIFDSIIQTIQDITGIAGSMDTARMNGATAIRQSLDGLRGAITGLKDKATRLQQAITALDSIDDPGVLTAENQRMIDEHREHLQQISDNLGAFQRTLNEKVQAFNTAAAGEDESRDAAIADIQSMVNEVQQIDQVLDTINADIANLRRLADAGAGPGAPPAAPPAAPPVGGPGGYRELPPDPANPGRRLGQLGGGRRRRRRTGKRSRHHKVHKKRRTRRGGYTYPRSRTHVHHGHKKKHTKRHGRKKRGTKKKHHKKKH